MNDRVAIKGDVRTAECAEDPASKFTVLRDLGLAVNVEADSILHVHVHPPAPKVLDEYREAFLMDEKEFYRRTKLEASSPARVALTRLLKENIQLRHCPECGGLSLFSKRSMCPASS